MGNCVEAITSYRALARETRQNLTDEDVSELLGIFRKKEQHLLDQIKEYKVELANKLSLVADRDERIANGATEEDEDETDVIKSQVEDILIKKKSALLRYKLIVADRRVQESRTRLDEDAAFRAETMELKSKVMKSVRKTDNPDVQKKREKEEEEFENALSDLKEQEDEYKDRVQSMADNVTSTVPDVEAAAAKLLESSKSRATKRSDTGLSVSMTAGGSVTKKASNSSNVAAILKQSAPMRTMPRVQRTIATNAKLQSATKTLSTATTAVPRGRITAPLTLTPSAPVQMPVMDV